MIADDGTGHQLGEEADKQGKIQRILRCGCLSPIHVEEERQDRECKERHAQRHGGVAHSQIGLQQGVDVVRQKASVLKEAQQQHIHRHGAPQHQFSRFLIVLQCVQLQTCEEIEHNQQQQQDHKFHAAPGKEHQA